MDVVITCRAAGLRHRLLAVAALLLFFALALDTAGRKAATTDEPLHVVHAVVMQQTGTMRIPEMHVPLAYRLIGGLLRNEPALPDVTTTPAWPTLNAYDIGRQYLWRDDLATDRILWLGRFVVVMMGVLLGALLAAWLRSLTGGHFPAAALTLGLYALSPNLLAAASLATTDMAATVTWFAAIYTWWRYWRRPGGARWWLAALALGLALAAKLTGVLLLPLTLALAYVGAWAQGGVVGLRGRGRPALLWLGLLPVALLVLWALYGFDVAGALPMPAYQEAWRLLLTEVEVSHLNFFLGQISPIGSWWYFPVTLLLKTPLLQLALFALIPVVLWRAARRGDRGLASAVVFLTLPAAVLLAVAALSRLNFGYRHALPAVPFLMALAGMGLAWLWDWASETTLRPRARTAARVALGLAVMWTVIAALRTHPDHLAYFNEMARGRGDRYLGDSNLDWGQDLRLLAEYARAHEAATGQPVRFSYSGIADRAHDGLPGRSISEQFMAGEPFPAANPLPGRYAINASDLQGTGLVLGVFDEIDLYDWFRRQEPVTTLGGSILIFDVAEQADGAWMAHCATPGRALDDAAAERLVGRDRLRHLTFDCRNAWVVPPGPGWYVLPPDGAAWLDGWLTPPHEIYRHRANAYGPDYVMAYWPGDCSNEAPDDAPLACAPALRPYEGSDGGPAGLMAYSERGAEWATLWRVAEVTTAPLSVQAHLLDDNGAAQVADGLGFPADQWRPGDWFLQRHVFANAGQTLTTGLYDYVTLEPVGPRLELSKEE